MSDRHEHMSQGQTDSPGSARFSCIADYLKHNSGTRLVADGDGTAERFVVNDKTGHMINVFGCPTIRRPEPAHIDIPSIEHYNWKG